jgi:hypothetical protein
MFWRQKTAIATCTPGRWNALNPGNARGNPMKTAPRKNCKSLVYRVFMTFGGLNAKSTTTRIETAA